MIRKMKRRPKQLNLRVAAKVALSSEPTSWKKSKLQCATSLHPSNRDVFASRLAMIMIILTVSGGLLIAPPVDARDKSNASRDKSKKTDEAEAPKRKAVIPECEKATADASKAWANGENDEAIRILKEAEKKCKDSEHLYLLLSTILVRMDKRQEEAAEAARRAVEINPNYVASYLQYGLCLMACDKNREAAQNFERLVKLDPTSYEAWSSMGRIYGELGEEQRSKDCEAKAAVLEPGSREARFGVLRNLKGGGKLDDAKRELKTILNDDNTEPEFFIVVAQEALKIGAYEEAVKAADQALAAYPTATTALESKAAAQLWSRDYKGVLETVGTMSPANDSSSAISSGSASAIAAKGIALLQLGRTQEARSFIESAFARDFKSKTSNYGKALLLERTGTFSDAIEALESSIAEEQEFAPAHVELARLYIKLGELDKAEEEISEIERSPEYVSSANAMAARIALEGAPARKSLEEALRLARAAFKANDNDPDALAVLSLCELKTNNLTGAREFTRKALSIEPGNIDALLGAAKVSLAEEDKPKRMEFLQRALAIAPGNSEVLASIADAYIQANEADEGINALRKGLEVNEGDPIIAYMLARTYEKQGQTTDAVKMFQQSLKNGLRGPRAKQARSAIERLSQEEKSPL